MVVHHFGGEKHLDLVLQIFSTFTVLMERLDFDPN